LVIFSQLLLHTLLLRSCALLCGKAQPVCLLMLPPAPVLVEESGKGSRRKQPGQKLGSSNAQQLSCWAWPPRLGEQLLALRRAQLADPGRQPPGEGMCRQKLPIRPGAFRSSRQGNSYPTGCRRELPASPLAGGRTRASSPSI